MDRNISFSNRGKLIYLIGIIIITLSVYVSFKYLLAYVWPFVLGGLIALLIEKPVNNIYLWVWAKPDKCRKNRRVEKRKRRIKSFIATFIISIVSLLIIVL